MYNKKEREITFKDLNYTRCPRIAMIKKKYPKVEEIIRKTVERQELKFWGETYIAQVTAVGRKGQNAVAF